MTTDATTPGKHAARDAGWSLLHPDRPGMDPNELARRDADAMAVFGGAPPWRPLTPGEIDRLRAQGSQAADWATILVCDPFDAALVRNCRFYGLVRLGPLEPALLEVAGLAAPVTAGLRECTLVSCDLGAGVAIDRAGRLAHVIIGDRVILQGVGRVETTPDAVFGAGRARGPKGERLWIEVGNENGGRAILPFAGMLTADAWLWSRQRQNAALMERLRAMTDAEESSGARYGQIGAGAVVLDAGALIDVWIGPAARVEGALRLESVTFLSDADAPCRVGPGVVAIEGVAGPGARLGAGVQARRFVLGENARLETGARVAHCVLGDNSTIACCEVQHSLVFPFHEQHHNSSFLIAATLQGQSNVASGATIGSNHNSRSPDGEILAGRGFWPGLCSNFKHNCRFASYVLVAKGNYPSELNVTLPFSLLATDEGGGHGLVLRPAWWFLHGMHSVERNQWKFQSRDRRHHARQRIVSEALAPDTAEEILAALRQIEAWAGFALQGHPLPWGDGPWQDASWPGGRTECQPDPAPEAVAHGRRLLRERPEEIDAIALDVFGVENSPRPTRVLKAGRAYAMYRDMLWRYAVLTLASRLDATGDAGLAVLATRLGVAGVEDRERRWENFGGQLVAGADADRLRADIVTGAVARWQNVHDALDRAWNAYPEARARHALAVLLALDPPMTQDGGPATIDWAACVRRTIQIQESVTELVERSRAKDFTQPFRRVTFESPAEMTAVLGQASDDAFLRQAKETSAASIARLRALLP